MSLRSLGTSAIPSNLGMSNGVGATKKIFVGGLHYETKDGACFRTPVALSRRLCVYTTS